MPDIDMLNVKSYLLRDRKGLGVWFRRLRPKVGSFFYQSAGDPLLRTQIRITKPSQQPTTIKRIGKSFCIAVSRKSYAMLDNYPNTAERRLEPRYKPCQILTDQQIPYVIWFEDALHHHGVPVVVFDLYLLVPDIDIAAECLVEAGWTVDTQGPYKIGNAEVELPQRGLLHPNSDMKTVLLPAEEWRFPLTAADAPLETSTDWPYQQLSFPTLPGFLDALLDSWLDYPDEDSNLTSHLACQVLYLYGYVQPLMEPSFSDQLKYEHRQYHFDTLAGMTMGTLPARRHQRAIRDALLPGQYQLCECSTPRDNTLLFSSKLNKPNALFRSN
ncbi:hypothetical protein UA08_08861 [Talaromyces atroroseus]|uniref:Uncharacterized protein n=1 Tax=Talaromyces atroroseus TaxID=1441469 RepID=A0A225A5Y0_TALAT|nr:hypothetical protein UA08_08861 [Talaromyces atroroseus]OKL55871.1 hypothetical protein UA08_08861 [Talaromyces atroroseus]